MNQRQQKRKRSQRQHATSTHQQTVTTPVATKHRRWRFFPRSSRTS